MAKRRDIVATSAALVAVIAGLAIGFHMLGPPRNQRAINADLRRVRDLWSMAQQIRAGGGSAFAASQLRDPITNAPYEYVSHPGSLYELCATFAFATTNEDEANRQHSAFWNHPAGRYCYRLDSGRPPVW